MNLDLAIDIITRAAAAELIRDHFEDKWEDHPLIGEHDWAEIDAHASEVLLAKLSPTSIEYDAAYEWLAARAEDEA